MAGNTGPKRHAGALLPDLRLIGLVVAAVFTIIVVRNVFVDAHRVIGWAVAAVVMAVLLSPVIERIDRVLPRVVAVIVTFLAVGAVSVGLIWTVRTGLRHEVDRLVERAPEIAENIENGEGRIADVAREFDLGDRIQELATRLDEHVGTDADTIRSTVLSAPAYLVATILTIFMLVFGPRIVDGALEQLAPVRRSFVRRSMRRAVAHSQFYVWATFAQGVVVGVVIGICARLMSVPAPAVLGVGAGVAAMVPYVGILLGSLPVLVLGFGIAGTRDALIVATVAIGLQIVEAVWWRPVVTSRSLYVGPAILWVVAIVGFAVYGIGGAMYATIIAVFIAALVDELSDDSDELPTPIDDFAADGISHAMGTGPGA